MKKILALSLTIAAVGLTACQPTATNNTNIRGANTNTGYVTNNTNIPTPTPSTAITPTANSNMSPTGGMKPSSDMKAPMNSNMNKKMDPKMSNTQMNK